MAAASTYRIARQLRRADPRLGALIARLGPRSPPRLRPGFSALARAIIYQQISTAAGAAIERRVAAAAGRRTLPGASWFRSATDPALRAAGLSPQKIRYLRDLAARVGDRRLELRLLGGLTDEPIIERLAEVHGIGRWTAQMYLLFHLHRDDVLPTGDLGLRKAVMRTYGFKALPAESTVARLGRRWSPFRSHATFYLWQSLHGSAGVVGPTRRPRRRRASGASRRTATRPGRGRRRR